MIENRYRVAIVGAGPSGLALATELRRLGVDDVAVLEREQQAGGIPRHCGHSPFGMREFRRVLSGPAYARRLEREARQAGVELRLATTVTSIDADARLTVSTAAGIERVTAERVVLCTGNRETPRSARLVSGSRPLGVLTTGALQAMTYLKRRIPFRRPVIVGTELVAFSALLTCRHFGIRPPAMIEAGRRTTAAWPARLLPPLLGTRLLTRSELLAIHGEPRVEAVEISTAGASPVHLDCDGVLFCGRFVAETALFANSHLALACRGRVPAVDQYGRCSDHRVFACGNLLHPVDTAGWCWAEGRRLAGRIAASLAGELPAPRATLEIALSSPALKYVTPQRIALDAGTVAGDDAGLQIRFDDERSGRLVLRTPDRCLVERRVVARRERRVLLPLPERWRGDERLSLDFDNT